MYKMYCWSFQPNFIAVAHAESVAQARELVLLEIGDCQDNTTPERAKAREWVISQVPSIWNGPNAEFALTDSAELRECEKESERYFQLLRKHNISTLPEKV